MPLVGRPDPFDRALQSPERAPMDGMRLHASDAPPAAARAVGVRGLDH